MVHKRTGSLPITLEDSSLGAMEQGGTGTAGEHPSQQCWGCGLQIALPNPSPVFKCGWCGAITREHDPNHRSRRPTRCCQLAIAARDWTMVAIVLCLCTGILVGGVWATFPVVLPSASIAFFLHSVLTAVLAFGTYFNYMAAAFFPAGVVPPLPFGAPERVPQGSLDGCLYCCVCQQPKPPTAHHCRVCGTCVLGMDHHCPFVGNCVGEHNQRAFILFLVYCILGCSYALFLIIWTLTIMLPDVLRLVDKERVWASVRDGIPTNLQLLSFLGQLRLIVTLRIAAALYIAVVSIAVIVGVGILLHQQLSAIYEGHNLIDSIQGPLANGTGIVKGRLVQARSERLSLLRRVFGPGHLLTWLLIPRWPSRAHHYSSKTK